MRTNLKTEAAILQFQSDFYLYDIDANRWTLVTGDTRSGVKRFLDFWNGPGSWERLPEERRAAFNARMHQVTMNFSAIYSENLSLSDLRRVAVPTQVMVGDRSPLPSRLVAGAIADALPVASLLGLGGVGHMSPITHPDRIARELMDYLDAALPPAAGTKGRQGAPRSIGRAVENPRAA